MHLVVHIPFTADEENARALSCARQAPSYTLEWSDGRKFAVAVFSSLPAGVDLAMRLIGEAVRVPGAWASMDARRVSSLAGLWQRLSCYRESLGAEDLLQYCRDKSSQFNHLVGCEEYRCPVPCQFICTPCLHLEREDLPLGSSDRYKLAAELAEIEWCPQLTLPRNNEAVLIRPGALLPRPAPAS